MGRSRLVALLWGAVLLSRGVLTPAQTLPAGVINSPPTIVGSGQSIGSDTTLNLYEGGYVGGGFNAGLPDGSSTDVLVNISGGVVYNGLTANAGSTVNVNGGEVYEGFSANAGSTVNVSDGIVWNDFWAKPGSTVGISGGIVLDGFWAEAGSAVTISGGRFADLFFAGSDAELVGGEFRLNGKPYVDSSISITRESGFTDLEVFTGTFADGSPFLFSTAYPRGYPPVPYTQLVIFNFLADVSLTSSALPPIDLTPILVDGSGSGAPEGLRAGQSLTLRDGGEIGYNFVAIDATLNVEGGYVTSNAEVFGAVVNMSGGTIGGSFDAYNSVLNISGGRIPSGLRVFEGSTVNFSGIEFLLDGVPVALEAGSPTVVSDRSGLLSGRLADGAEFEFFLSPSDISSGFPRSGHLSNDATLTLTLVSPPGDYNRDGVVNAGDYAVWSSNYGEIVPASTGADGNGDGVVDAADYTVWRKNAATPGDYDGDGVVDANDYDAWSAGYGQSVTPYSGADGNGNGVIDAGDYTVWRDNATSSPNEASLRSVPEPVSAWLLLVAALLCATPSRRDAAPK